MTRVEKLQDKNGILDVAKEICDLISEKVDCEECPFTERCSRGHSGVLNYLMEEVQDD